MCRMSVMRKASNGIFRDTIHTCHINKIYKHFSYLVLLYITLHSPGLPPPCGKAGMPGMAGIGTPGPIFAINGIPFGPNSRPGASSLTYGGNAQGENINRAVSKNIVWLARRNTRALWPKRWIRYALFQLVAGHTLACPA